MDCYLSLSQWGANILAFFVKWTFNCHQHVLYILHVKCNLHLFPYYQVPYFCFDSDFINRNESVFTQRLMQG